VIEIGFVNFFASENFDSEKASGMKSYKSANKKETSLCGIATGGIGIFRILFNGFFNGQVTWRLRSH
jgi:hypothetical protein